MYCLLLVCTDVNFRESLGPPPNSSRSIDRMRFFVFGSHPRPHPTPSDPPIHPAHRPIHPPPPRAIFSIQVEGPNADSQVCR